MHLADACVRLRKASSHKGIICLRSHKMALCMLAGWVVRLKTAPSTMPVSSSPAPRGAQGKDQWIFCWGFFKDSVQNGRRVLIIFYSPEPSTRRAWWLTALAEEAACLGSLLHLILCHCLSWCFWVEDLRAGSFLVDNQSQEAWWVSREQGKSNYVTTFSNRDFIPPGTVWRTRKDKT